jgi:pimeloyl-ACP methyl ester carboxylesterase
MATQETAKTLFLTAESIDYAYRLIGNASDSPPLLLLNHVRATIDTWDPYVINNLTASGRQLITYDYAGIGHSGGSVAPSIKGFAVNLLAFLNVLLPTLHVDQVDVLGYSMGGYVAQQLSLDNPDIIRKLVLSGTGPSFGPDLQRPRNDIQSAIFAPNTSLQSIIDAFFPDITGEEGADWLVRSTTSRAGIAGKDGEPPIALFTTGQSLVNLTQAYLSWDADTVPYSLLQSIQRDVLVTAGDNDLIIPTQNSFVLARQIPRANLFMFGSSGHGHPFEYAGFYTNLVTEFLNGLLPTAPFSSGQIPPLGTHRHTTRA